MHINSHFALGVIIASLFNNFFHFNLIEFSIIVLFSFVCDFDVFFSKFAKDNNHRMLITHSIIPSLIVLFLGFTLNWIVLIIAGISYSIHILFDTLDWGTNFFYFQKKQVGLKFLISKEEFENLTNYLSKYNNPASFFDEKYYKNRICLGFEIILFILMMIFIIIYAFEYILITILYFPFIWFHLTRHFHLKKIETIN
ncbi:MAG: hypothetical protein ACFFDH_11475 [Promethearchaeota archaeon]